MNRSASTKTSRQGERASRGKSGGGGGGIALHPPSYGIDHLDRAASAEAPNRIGMPDALKAGIEALSGIDLSPVRVHTNSPEPARLNALAFTRGTEIHLAPGQEKHLAHEAWHVVQQSRGGVGPTLHAHGAAINDDPALEREADTMGARAAENLVPTIQKLRPAAPAPGIVQRMTDPPAKIVVYFETGSSRVAKVENDKGATIGHVLAETHKGIVPEGYVVLMLAGQLVASARFATEAADITSLGGMAKIAAKNIEVKETAPPPKPEKISTGPKGAADSDDEEAPAPRRGLPAATLATPALATKTFKLTLKTGVGASIVTEKFTGFEKGHADEADQGQIHFEKHGDEFEAEDKASYIRMAKAFGESGEKFCLEAIIGNTIIKVDPDGMELRRVFIANAKKIRTFYAWDPDYSSDPFAYAIYYTITSNLGIPLAQVDPRIIALLDTNGVDLAKMEVEVITNLLRDGKSNADIQRETLAPMRLIERIVSQNWELEMNRGLNKPDTTPELDPKRAAKALKAVF